MARSGSVGSNDFPDWEMPACSHVPGCNPRPADGIVHTWAEQVHAVADLEDPFICRAWQYALHLVREGFYWESHEVLEQIWLKAPPNSQERIFVRGMIHLANAALKTRMSRTNAAIRLAHLAYHCFYEASLGRKTRIFGFLCSDAMAAASSVGQPGVDADKQRQALAELVMRYEK